MCGPYLGHEPNTSFLLSWPLHTSYLRVLVPRFWEWWGHTIWEQWWWRFLITLNNASLPECPIKIKRYMVILSPKKWNQLPEIVIWVTWLFFRSCRCLLTISGVEPEGAVKVTRVPVNFSNCLVWRPRSTIFFPKECHAFESDIWGRADAFAPTVIFFVTWDVSE